MVPHEKFQTKRRPKWTPSENDCFRIATVIIDYQRFLFCCISTRILSLAQGDEIALIGQNARR